MQKEVTEKLIPPILSAVLFLYPAVLGLILYVFNIHVNMDYPPFSTIEEGWLVLWVFVSILIGLFYFEKWWQRILCIIVLGPSLPFFQSIAVTSFSCLYFGQWVLLATWVYFVLHPIESLTKKTIPFIKDSRRWLLLVGGCFQVFLMTFFWRSGSRYFFALTLFVGVSMIGMAIGGWKKEWSVALFASSFLLHGVIIGFSWLVPMVQAWRRDFLNY